MDKQVKDEITALQPLVWEVREFIGICGNFKLIDPKGREVAFDEWLEGFEDVLPTIRNNRLSHVLLIVSYDEGLGVMNDGSGVADVSASGYCATLSLSVPAPFLWPRFFERFNPRDTG